MTANELADLIENEDTLWLEPHLNTIATMLRQQQAEIEELRLRELTDREIMELYCLTSDNNPLDFARAILKKASEK
jgi:hypothetical protein